jgi:LmbE family N-acetylglucosaminyl deacetylase
MNTVLVVAAHPDDEILGCGATVHQHVEAGDVVNVIIACEGATSRHDGPQPNTKKARTEVARLREAANAAAKVLGTEKPRFFGLPDNRLDEMALLDVVRLVEREVSDLKPTIVYTHHGRDLNVDHRKVNQAVLTACRPLPGFPVREIYAFETLSSTEWGLGPPFTPTRFMPVTEQSLAAKVAALNCYQTEMRAFPHSRSYEAVRSLATVRGAQAGLHAAEAFEVLRQVPAQQAYEIQETAAVS